MTTIRIEDRKQCDDVLPVNDFYGSGIIRELRCILDAGHDGFHRDKEGAYWVNQHAIVRRQEPIGGMQ